MPVIKQVSAGNWIRRMALSHLAVQRVTASHAPSGSNHVSRAQQLPPAAIWLRPARYDVFADLFSARVGATRAMVIARAMTEDEYNNVANELLDEILGKLEVEEDVREGFEVHASGDGVIHVTIADKGTWVLNKQIWLSSPITGPTHYKLVGVDWVCTKDCHLLLHRLREQLYIQVR